MPLRDALLRKSRYDVTVKLREFRTGQYLIGYFLFIRSNLSVWELTQAVVALILCFNTDNSVQIRSDNSACWSIEPRIDISVLRTLRTRTLRTKSVIITII